MKMPIVILALALLAGTLVPGVPAARELGQDEVRDLAARGHSQPLAQIYESVRRATRGDPVDVRAFDMGEVYYRVLVMMPNGQVGSVVVDARSGRLLPSNSAAANEVREAADAAPGNSGNAPGNSGNAPGNSGNAPGRDNGRGQGNSNAGGNSGGNGGGGGGGGGEGGGGEGKGKN